MEIIRSRQNPLAKQLVKLAESRRERLKVQQTLLIGTHLIEAATQANWPLQKLLVCEGEENRPEIAALLQSANTSLVMLDKALFSDIEQAPSTSGLMALCTIPTPPSPLQEGFCLLLDSVQDPGNVGSILRTAAAAGVNQVWLTTGCADIWSPRVLRAGMGAHFLLPVLERLPADKALRQFKGHIAITALQEATSLYDSDLRGNLVLVMGSEGAGVSPTLAELATQRLRIPIASGLESLNVAAATAICLFERNRQLLQNTGKS